jgi:hypothetical protein
MNDLKTKATELLARLPEEDRPALLRLLVTWPPFDRDPECLRLLGLGFLCVSADPEGDRLVFTEAGKLAASLAVTPIPRLAYGHLDGERVRLWGDLDDTGVSLAGVASMRLWRVHEPLDRDSWRECFKRCFHNDVALEQVAAELRIQLDPLTSEAPPR